MAFFNLEKLYKRRHQLEQEMVELFNAGADSETGVMTDEQRAKFDEVRVNVEKLDKDIANGEEMQKREMAEDDNEYREFGNEETPDNKEKRFETFGDQMAAVYRSYSPSHGVDPRLLSTRQSGLNEGVPAEGGFLVQQDFAAEMLKRVYETGVLYSRTRQIPISANANGLRINGIDETSRATGSRHGGVRGYWLAEAQQKTPSMPTFRQIILELKKIACLYYATDELLQDTSALGPILEDAFSEEIGWLVDDAIYRGNGVGQMQGILNSPALVTVAPEAGQNPNTIVFENILAMWSRMYARSRPNSAWFISQDVEPQLYSMSLAVGTGGLPVFLPAGGASSAPYATLMGRPVIPIEHASSIGNVGDIALLDLSQYVTIDKGGIQSASSIHVRFIWDETCFRMVYRVDGQSLWQAALTPANLGNTVSPFVVLDDRP